MSRPPKKRLQGNAAYGKKPLKTLDVKSAYPLPSLGDAVLSSAIRALMAQMTEEIRDVERQRIASWVLGLAIKELESRPRDEHTHKVLYRMAKLIKMNALELPEGGDA